VRRALLYDVHGNLPALEAVLDDAREAGVDGFVLGGDYVLFGAYPIETLELLDQTEAAEIRGNTDRWIAGDEDDLPDGALPRAALSYARQALGETRCAELGSLPEMLAQAGALICHASPSSDMQSFSVEPSELDDKLLDGTHTPMVVFGHTHIQFKREHEGQLLVNPGSVGLPFDGDVRAAYAIWNGDGNVELRRVAYDNERYARELRRRMAGELGESADTLARRIEQALFVA
jgi:putative phosphoesterase